MSKKRINVNATCSVRAREMSRRFGAGTLKPVEAPLNCLRFCSLLILGFSTTAWGQEPANPRNLLPGDGITSVKTLDQNWSDVESRAFYNAPQGSQLIPYPWFLHLEQAKNEKPFLDPAHIRSMGYLPRSRDSVGNPDGLPIGFVKDMPFPDGTPALGMSCAACHTTQINHNHVAWLIDGAPTLGDIETLQRRLVASLKATIDSKSKFERFANNLQVSPDNHTKLKKDLKRFKKLRLEYNNRNMPGPGAPPFGHGRVDAFGGIMNEVLAYFLDIPENVRPSTAPVSYPFLWDTPQHNFVQWNGIAKNTVSGLAAPFIGTRYIGALGRNTAEVLGVFGNVNVSHRELFGGYPSSVNHQSLIQIEASLRKLWSPLWPAEEFGAINDNQRVAGRGLFNLHCASCHTNNGKEYKFDRTDPNRFVDAKMEAVGTDTTDFLNFALRRAKTGVLKGRPRTLGNFFHRLKAEESGSTILTHVVQRVVVGRNFKTESANHEELAALEVPMTLNLSFRTSEGVLTGNFRTIIPHGDEGAYLVSGEDLHFTPHAETLPNAGMLALFVKSDGTCQFHGRTESHAADRFKTLSEIRPLPEMSRTGSTVLQLRVKAKIKVKYKARVLDGIWATAPYLHNGSVPNLWELLQPANKRTKSFYVGNREFDKKNVGFRSDSGPRPKLDTTQPGNSNAGHEGREYGTLLSDVEKRQLIEFLKSL